MKKEKIFVSFKWNSHFYRNFVPKLIKQIHVNIMRQVVLKLQLFAGVNYRLQIGFGLFLTKFVRLHFDCENEKWNSYYVKLITLFEMFKRLCCCNISPASHLWYLNYLSQQAQSHIFTKSQKHVHIFCSLNLQKWTVFFNQRKFDSCWMNEIKSMKLMRNYFGTRFLNLSSSEKKPDTQNNISIFLN